MSNIVFWLLMAICTNCLNIEAARILAFFPIPSISHSKVFQSLTHELSKQGHQVTVVTPDPKFSARDAPPNLTEIDVHDLSYNMWREQIIPLFHKPIHYQIRYGYPILNEMFMVQMKSDVVQKLSGDKNMVFDVILIESTMQTEVVLSYIYNAPIIQVSSYGASYDNYNIIGAPDNALVYQNMFRAKLYNLSFWDKALEFYTHVTNMNNFIECELSLNEMLKHNFGLGVPSLTELRNKVEMLFLNINPLWDTRPVPPGVIYMGGLHLKGAHELPKDLKEYLDTSLNGVIYVSFGSNVQLSTLPAEMIRIFLKVFSQLPYDVLLKSDMDEIEGRSKNVQLFKWFPQADILRHPNVKLFITQGGLQSTDETITGAVPIIGIPIVGDQNINVEQCEHFGAGVKLDKNLITVESFQSTIINVITNKSYHQNMVRLRSWMRDQRHTSIERLVWWTEYVLRYGGAQHLRAPGANMHWTEKLELNLLLLTFLVSLFFILFFVIACYYLFKTLIILFNLRL